MSTISDQKRKLALEQNQILMQILSHVDDNGVDTQNIDLSNFETRVLRDFWVYSSGFLCLNNYENYDLSMKEIQDINRGKFALRFVSDDEVREYYKMYNKPFPQRGLPFSTDIVLDKVQDAKFHLHTNQSIDGKGYGTVLKLDTKKPIMVSDYGTKLEGDIALKIVRNVYAHNTPFIDGSTLKFMSKHDEINVSKMWLRGFSELFARKHAKFDVNKARETMIAELSNQGNYIENEKGIDDALSSIKGFVSSGVLKNFHRVNQLVKLRTRFYPDFFRKSFDEKVDIIVALVARNQIFFENGYGAISPAIIYNLQQLVSAELDDREVFALLSDDETDECLLQAKELMKRLDESTKRLDRINSQYPEHKRRGNQTYIVLISAALKESDKIQNEWKVFENKVRARLKLESSGMKLFSTAELEKLPLELAFNAMSIMAFHSVVTSGFYEEMLAKTNFNSMNNDQVKFFESFDMSAFKFNGRQFKPSASSNAFLLLCVREALCHSEEPGGRNGIFYKLSAKMGQGKPTLNDVEVEIVAQRQNVVISGKLSDFIKLFSSSQFTDERSDNVKTAEINTRYMMDSNGVYYYTLTSDDIYRGKINLEEYRKDTLEDEDEGQSGQ